MTVEVIHEIGSWAIGLLQGPSLDCLKSTELPNPIVTASDSEMQRADTEKQRADDAEREVKQLRAKLQQLGNE